MARRPSSYVASVAVIVVATSFLGAALVGGGQIRGTGVPYTALFSSCQGLNVGADVEVAGVPVGAVTSIVLDQRTAQAKVTFTVSRAIAVSSDSAISVSGGESGGSAVLELSPSRGGRPLQAGAALVRTNPAVSLEGTIGSFIFGSGLPGSG